MVVSLVSSSSSLVGFPNQPQRFAPRTTERWKLCRLISRGVHTLIPGSLSVMETTKLQTNVYVKMCDNDSSIKPRNYVKTKSVWIWTECKDVMTAAAERGWNTFVFTQKNQELANEWSSMVMINPLFIKEDQVLNSVGERVGKVLQVSGPEGLQKLLLENQQAENLVLDLLDWQIIPAENLVAAFQGSKTTVFAVSKTSSEAQIFLEALEHGLGGIVLKTEDTDAILELKVYFDRRDEEGNTLDLRKATITNIQPVGMGDRVCVDLCSLMKPGEGILVGSFARGLFLVHSECLETNYIASRPFRINAGPVHAYVVIPGGRTCYLSELRTGREVIVVDGKGKQRTGVVGRVKIETRPLVLVEAKTKPDLDDQTTYSILLQNAETVALIRPPKGNGKLETAAPVTGLKVGDQVLLRIQGGGRHTGIEIEEFIVEN